MRELVKITLGGAEHWLRPTWEAYGEIEARCGSLKVLWQNIGFGGATLQDLSVVVAAGMRAAGTSDGRKVDDRAVSQRIYEAGVWSDDIRLPVLEFLESLGWTPEQRKKIQAEVEKREGKTSATSAESSLPPLQSTAD